MLTLTKAVCICACKKAPESQIVTMPEMFTCGETNDHVS